MKFKKILKFFIVNFMVLGLLMQCYGSFPLVRTVYKFNGSIGDNSKAGGVIRSVVMILMTVIPIYEISFLVDALLLNSIEFWTGNKIQLGLANPYIKLREEGDTLILSDKKDQYTFYLLRNRPGEVFIYKNQEYIPIQYEINEHYLILKDNERILLKKKLSEEQIAYLKNYKDFGY
ncbi:MAG: DUF3332 family protein [Leptonema sp. (in: bacteria)]